MCTVCREHPLRSAVREEHPTHAHRARRNHGSELRGPPGTCDTLRHRQRTRSSQEVHALKYTHTETLPPLEWTDGDRRALSTQREVLHSSYTSPKPSATPKPPATPQRGGGGGRGRSEEQHKERAIQTVEPSKIAVGYSSDCAILHWRNNKQSVVYGAGFIWRWRRGRSR